MYHFVEPWRPSFQDWHALLDAHDVVVRSQRAIRCAMSIRDAVQALGIEVRAGLRTGECEVRGAHQLKGVPGEWRLLVVASR